MIISLPYLQEEEQARLVRIQQLDKNVTQFDKRVRPYIDSLQQDCEEAGFVDNR